MGGLHYEQGVQHIVFVSVAGAEANKLVPHHAVEQCLITSGRSYTILRPGFFSQNLEGPYRNEIAQHSRISLPSGFGKINFIDTRDVAEIAIQALLNTKNYERQAYTLAGTESLTFHEVATILSAELGRSIRYQECSALGYFLRLVCQKEPLMKAFIQTVLHSGIKKGQANILDKSAAELLGRKTTSVSQYVRKNHALWAKQ